MDVVRRRLTGREIVQPTIAGEGNNKRQLRGLSRMGSQRGNRARGDGARCELCRRVSEHLSKTECCGRMVCMVLSGGWISKSSCLVKHSRFTLCGAHHTEEHGGDWKSCEVCPRTWPLEMYVWYGTNKWNFEKLENPPSYEPTHCGGCGRVIVLSKDAYSRNPDGSHRCMDCWED